MNFDTSTEETNDKLERIEEGLRYLIDLDCSPLERCRHAARNIR
jgi:hypothetical protein